MDPRRLSVLLKPKVQTKFPENIKKYVQRYKLAWLPKCCDVRHIEKFPSFCTASQAALTNSCSGEHYEAKLVHVLRDCIKHRIMELIEQQSIH